MNKLTSVGYERELKYKPVIMKKLGIEPKGIERSAPAETLAGYAERSLDGDDQDGDSTSEKDDLWFLPEAKKKAVEPETVI